VASSASEDRARKLANVGVPEDQIEATGEHVRIVLTHEQADRFSTAFAVLEETGAIKTMLQTVWENCSSSADRNAPS
jgi:hypothetical protein